MSLFGILIAGFFLPLFPFSMAFNRLFARLNDHRSRMGLLLLWPQFGVLTLIALDERPPAWVLWWAVATAALYALRALTLSDLGLWTGFMATSAWALLWPTATLTSSTPGGGVLVLQAVGLSLPLILLAWLISRLETLLGAAYAGVCGGLSAALPRLSALLTFAILAAVATPLVPGFFTLLSTTVHVLPIIPGVALLILTVWLLWAWGGARILSGFIAGPSCGIEPSCDLEFNRFGWLGLSIAVLVLVGVGLSGELI